MILYRFTIPGPPVPFIANWRLAGFIERKRYMSWAKDARGHAAIQNVPPLEASQEKPLLVHTRAFFKDRKHSDPENIRKAVVDSLFYESRGRGGKRSSARDKYVGGACAVPCYDKDAPRIEVVIADGRLPLRDTVPEDW